MRKRYEISDEQWERIQTLLPGRKGHVGATALDNRRFVNGCLWILRSGAPWRDLPERYGDWNSTYRRFSRWAKSGVWERIFKHLSQDKDNEYLMIDSSIVRAHQVASGSKRGLMPKGSDVLGEG